MNPIVVCGQVAPYPIETYSCHNRAGHYTAHATSVAGQRYSWTDTAGPWTFDQARGGGLVFVEDVPQQLGIGAADADLIKDAWEAGAMWAQALREGRAARARAFHADGYYHPDLIYTSGNFNTLASEDGSGIPGDWDCHANNHAGCGARCEA